MENLEHEVCADFIFHVRSPDFMVFMLDGTKGPGALRRTQTFCAI